MGALYLESKAYERLKGGREKYMKVKTLKLKEPTVARMWISMYKACVENLLSESINQLPVHIFKVQTCLLDAIYIAHLVPMDVLCCQNSLWEKINVFISWSHLLSDLRKLTMRE